MWMPGVVHSATLPATSVFIELYDDDSPTAAWLCFLAARAVGMRWRLWIIFYSVDLRLNGGFRLGPDTDSHGHVRPGVARGTGVLGPDLRRQCPVSDHSTASRCAQEVFCIDIACAGIPDNKKSIKARSITSHFPRSR